LARICLLVLVGFFTMGLPTLERRPDILMTLVKILCRRTRQASQQVEDVMFRHLESRLAKALLHLATAAGLQSSPGSSVELRVSQRELGSMAGGSRESVNKLLWQWQKQGVIDLGKGSIVIHDIAALDRMI
jgi:CRP-like cAMP-binding protein